MIIVLGCMYDQVMIFKILGQIVPEYTPKNNSVYTQYLLFPDITRLLIVRTT